MKIFTGNANRSLAEGVVHSLKIPLGKAVVGEFPDSETQVAIEENVRGEDVFVIQSTCPSVNQHWMELFLLIDALRRASASRITAVLPYFGYARQDRKDRPRVPISAKLVASLLQASGANRVLALDFHAQQIAGFFDIPVDHLFASNVFFQHIKNKEWMNNIVVVSPDVSGIKIANVWAERFSTPMAVVAKRRNGSNDVDADMLIGDVEGKAAIIVDDIASTGGTLALASRLLLSNGAQSVSACVSHNLLDEKAMLKLKQSGIQELIATNSVPPNKQTGGLKVTTLSVAKLLGEAILRIHNNVSISSLFESKSMHNDEKNEDNLPWQKRIRVG